LAKSTTEAKLAEADALLKLMKAEIRTLAAAPERDQWQGKAKLFEGRLKRAQLLGHAGDAATKRPSARNDNPSDVIVDFSTLSQVFSANSAVFSSIFDFLTIF
jgi:hypothetical protein